uniref:G-protein coupled receptors family 1 profile domain-containing protein n=1 Tax=Tetranychus urticae TaxID=32264 RepID=T1L2P8_TETUR
MSKLRSQDLSLFVKLLNEYFSINFYFPFHSIITIVGNVMVMISFKMDKQLQTISNYFLLSLSIADFLIEKE